jgi:type I restriction enzyme, R subunit
VRGLVTAIDPDRQHEAAQRETGTANPTPAEVEAVATNLIEEAVKPLAANPELRNRILDVRRSYEQTIDETSKDEVTFAGASKDAKDRARAYVTDFRRYLEEHRDEITALQLFYNIPFAQRPTFEQIKELAHAIERTPQRWTPERLWEAYEALDRSKVHGSGRRMLTDLVSIVRYSFDLTPELVG